MRKAFGTGRHDSELVPTYTTLARIDTQMPRHDVGICAKKIPASWERPLRDASSIEAEVEYYFAPAGTRRFSSWNQLSTAWICRTHL